MNGQRIGHKEDSISMLNPAGYIDSKESTYKQPRIKRSRSKFAGEVFISWKNLNYSVQIARGKCGRGGHYQRIIVDQMNGVAKPGEVMAIMGPSGSGKTSLLNLLSDRVAKRKGSKITGQIFVNDKQFSSKDFGKFAAYIMQDDILMETMTVRESLEFAAALRLSKTSQRDRTELIDELLRDLRLQNCQHTKVGSATLRGVSGGERKRTSIAVELISNPSVIFLDEPTSGLDSFTAYTVINVLKLLAQQGKTVIMTIHSPSSDIYKMFDRLLLLMDGKQIYQGGLKESILYFRSLGVNIPRHANPADIFMMVLSSKATASEIEQNEKKNLHNKMKQRYVDRLQPTVEKDIESSRAPTQGFNLARVTHLRKAGLCTQTRHLFRRTCRNQIRNPGVLRARFGQAIFMGLLMLIFFNGNSLDDAQGLSKNEKAERLQNIIGALFFLIINTTMVGIMMLLVTFPVERAVFLREQANKTYDVFPYYYSKVIAELPTSIVPAFIQILICYFVIGFASNARSFFIIVGSIWMLTLSTTGIGLFLGTAVSDASIAIMLAPITVMPFILFSGVLANTDTIPSFIAWFQYVSPMRYAMEAALRGQMEQVQINFNDGKNVANPLNSLNYDFGLSVCFGVLVGLSFVFRLLAYLCLKRLVKKTG